MKITKSTPRKNVRDLLKKGLTSANNIEISSIISKIRRPKNQYHKNGIDGEDLPEKEQVINKKLILLGLLAGNVVFFFGNYGINMFWNFLDSIMTSDKSLLDNNINTSFNFKYFFVNSGGSKLFIPMYFIMVLGITTLLYVKLKRNSKESIAYGQKGDSRLATIKDIQQQYAEIPEKTVTYKGIGGVPISHYMDKYYVDVDTVNTIVLGASRSGKGETFIVPMIDNLSRATEQSNMVVNDPKGELFSASKETLEKRGYRVLVLNIDDPLQSMSFNPLQLVIDSWANKDYHEASKRANTLTAMLFASGMGTDNEFFYKSAKSAVNAIILTIVEDCFKNNAIEKITMYNVAQMLNELGSLFYTDPTNPNKELNALDEYFNTLPQGNQAKIQYGSTSFAGDKAKGSILSTASQGIEMFTSDLFGKLTSKMSIDLKEIGFPKSLQFRLDTSLTGKRVFVRFLRKEGNTLTLISENRIKVKALGLCVLNFDEQLKHGDILEVVYKESDSKKQHVRYSMDFSGQIKDPHDSSVELRKYKTEKGFTALSTEKIVLKYTDKPTAVFMVIPDYDPSNHVIGSIFISQLYTELATNCKDTPSKKCFRRVHFILDEFGNMPAIDNMSGIMTVCLGRNILFNLAVQSYSQLEDKYDKGAKTIKENCQNHILIMTNDPDTIEEISKKCGRKTEAVYSSNGKHMDIDPSIGRSADEQRLITPERASQLIEGEQVILRNLHRQDKDRNKIRPFPIFNTKETNMPYRWQFLNDDFDTRKDINDIDIECSHIDLSLYDNLIPFASFIKDLKTRLHYSILNKTKITMKDFELFSLLPPKQQEQFDYEEIVSLLENERNQSNVVDMEAKKIDEQLKNSISSFREVVESLKLSFKLVPEDQINEEQIQFFERHLFSKDFCQMMLDSHIQSITLEDLMKFIPDIEACLKVTQHVTLTLKAPVVIIKNATKVNESMERLLDVTKVA